MARQNTNETQRMQSAKKRCRDAGIFNRPPSPTHPSSSRTKLVNIASPSRLSRQGLLVAVYGNCCARSLSSFACDMGHGKASTTTQAQVGLCHIWLSEPHPWYVDGRRMSGGKMWKLMWLLPNPTRREMALILDRRAGPRGCCGVKKHAARRNR